MRLLRRLDGVPAASPIGDTRNRDGGAKRALVIARTALKQDAIVVSGALYGVLMYARRPGLRSCDAPLHARGAGRNAGGCEHGYARTTAAFGVHQPSGAPDRRLAISFFWRLGIFYTVGDAAMPIRDGGRMNGCKFAFSGNSRYRGTCSHIFVLSATGSVKTTFEGIHHLLCIPRKI